MRKRVSIKRLPGLGNAKPDYFGCSPNKTLPAPFPVSLCISKSQKGWSCSYLVFNVLNWNVQFLVWGCFVTWSDLGTTCLTSVKSKVIWQAGVLYLWLEKFPLLNKFGRKSRKEWIKLRFNSIVSTAEVHMAKALLAQPLKPRYPLRKPSPACKSKAATFFSPPVPQQFYSSFFFKALTTVWKYLVQVFAYYQLCSLGL